MPEGIAQVLAKAVQIVRGQFRSQLQILVGQNQTTHARVKPEREQECPTSIQHHADVFICVQYLNNKNNERETDRQTDRQRQNTQRERETDRDRDRDRQRQTDRQTGRDKERETHTQRQRHRETQRQREKQTRERGERERKRQPVLQEFTITILVD